MVGRQVSAKRVHRQRAQPAKAQPALNTLKFWNLAYRSPMFCPHGCPRGIVIGVSAFPLFLGGTGRGNPVRASADHPIFPTSVG